MKMYLYTVYDRMSEEYGPLFEQKNSGVARRTYKQMLEKFAGREDEYRMYCMGWRDTETGDITLQDKYEVPPDGAL